MLRSLWSFVVVALLAVAIPGQLEAQGAEREVRAVIDRLFDGMRARDTAAIRSSLGKGKCTLVNARRTLPSNAVPRQRQCPTKWCA